jgi:hypothetical protein
MVATFGHPKLGTLFYIILRLYSFLDGRCLKKGMDDRLHEKCVQAVEVKKTGFLRDLLVRVLHSISSSI